MDKNGPIIFVEDDLDDQIFLHDVLEELQIENEVITFKNGADALEYLQRSGTDPFMIISDINMPVMSGIELKNHIQTGATFKVRMAPFLFLSTSIPDDIKLATDVRSVQGCFTKPDNAGDLKLMISKIIAYWSTCATATAPSLN